LRLEYLVAYQTDYEEAIKSEDYRKVPITSDLFPWKSCAESGVFNARNYKLIQDYDPDGVGEVPPKYIVTVEVGPSDDADYNAWYEEEHLDILHKIPEYRRSQRYMLGPKVGGATRGEPPRYVAIHEVDDVKGFFEGPEFDAAWSELTKRIVKDAKAFVVRGLEKIEAFGYNTK
jgi:hypothetical protein